MAGRASEEPASAQDLTRWVQEAAPGDRMVYGVAWDDQYPSPAVRAMARRLYDKGLALLFQVRGEAGRLSYVMQRTSKVSDKVAAPAARESDRRGPKRVPQVKCSRARAAWRSGSTISECAQMLGMLAPAARAVLFGHRCYAGDPDIITEAEKQERNAMFARRYRHEPEAQA